MLNNARSQYYYLTYLHPEQLYHLLDYVENPDSSPTEDLINALKFINPRFHRNMLSTVEIEPLAYSEDGDYEDLFDTLCSLGRFLDNVS